MQFRRARPISVLHLKQIPATLLRESPPLFEKTRVLRFRGLHVHGNAVGSHFHGMSPIVNKQLPPSFSIETISSFAMGVNNELAAVLPDDKPWYTKSHLVKLHFCILSLTMFSSANGYDGSLMNGLQALPQWVTFMDNPTGSWLGFLNAMYWLGMGVNYPLTAIVANKFGRKPGVYVGYTFLLAGSLAILSNSEIAFIMSRFLVGCASAWFANAVPLLINEISHPSYRGVLSALFMCGYYIGGTIAAFVTFGTRDYTSDWAWRIPSLLQLLLPIVALPGLLMTPESPRWLISVDRVEEARNMLIESHAGGDANSALVEYEMIEITSAIQLESTLKGASYAELFSTPGNRRRLLITVSLGAFSQWCGNGVVSYYLVLVLRTVGITSVTDQTLISGLLQVWNLLFAVVAAVSVDKVGRRPLFLASAGIMLVAYILVTALSGAFAESDHGPTGIAVIPFLFIFFAGYDIALTPLLTAYPCEIWPYRLRSHGLTVMWLTAVAVIFFNTFVNPVALEAIGWKYYFVFIVILIVMCFTVYFFYPETKGYTLEHMAVLFDGEDAVPESKEIASRAASAVFDEEKKDTAFHEEKVSTFTAAVHVRAYDRKARAEESRTNTPFINSPVCASFQTDAICSRELLLAIVDDYLASIYPLIPVVHRPSFLLNLEQNRDIYDNDFLGLLISICAVVIGLLPSRFDHYRMFTSGSLCAHSRIEIVDRCYHLLNRLRGADFFDNVGFDKWAISYLMLIATFQVEVQNLLKEKLSFLDHATMAAINLEALMPLEVDDEEIFKYYVASSLASQSQLATGFSLHSRIFWQALEDPLAEIGTLKHALDNAPSPFQQQDLSHPPHTAITTFPSQIAIVQVNIHVTHLWLQSLLLDQLCLLTSPGEHWYDRELICTQLLHVLRNTSERDMEPNGVHLVYKLRDVAVGLLACPFIAPDPAAKRACEFVQEFTDVLARLDVSESVNTANLQSWIDIGRRNG
ncbi:hypothetical protein OPT61_g3684 [Boeremia exigua]|uniref:Uncharacterized protein n=1 Tax=Boeremia exigua TaxID=749465 RepID=A0ACC2IGZ5_9PLEO|nr:hypothetical protein OPT61_g3684 [Boeremia exigua]